MSELAFKTARELQIELGKRVRELRLFRNLDQRTTAEKAGISKATYRNLEAGSGSSVETLLRTLKALDYLQGIEILVPQASVNPLALLGESKSPQRASRPRGPRKLKS
jgi:transcriptional regulator with XRE-family HTH domain